MRKLTDRPAMIVELKYGKSEDEVIGQIKKRDYVDGFKGYKRRCCWLR